MYSWIENEFPGCGLWTEKQREFVSRVINLTLEVAAEQCNIVSSQPSPLCDEDGCWKHAAVNCADKIRGWIEVEIDSDR